MSTPPTAILLTPLERLRQRGIRSALVSRLQPRTTDCSAKPHRRLPLPFATGSTEPQRQGESSIADDQLDGAIERKGYERVVPAVVNRYAQHFPIVMAMRLLAATLIMAVIVKLKMRMNVVRVVLVVMAFT